MSRKIRKVLLAILLRIAWLWKNDRSFLMIKYYLRTGNKLNLQNPKTFNEKLQWLKINCKKDYYSKLVDKAEVKTIVASIIGEEHIIPTLGVWDSVSEIDFDKLPEQFVLKCTHDSGCTIICNDKSTFNIRQTKVKLRKGLKRNYYLQNREYPYKEVKPRILAEKLYVDESGVELKDYKFFCFNGVPQFFKIDFGRFTNHRANYYDLDWNLLPFDEKGYPRDEKAHIVKPDNFEKMVDIANKLCQEFPFVRVDLYNVNGIILFGELTFFPASGMTPFEPTIWDTKIGNLLVL